MNALANQLSLAAMQQQLSELATTQSAQGAVLAQVAAAVEHGVAPAAGEGAQQQLQQ
jgi:hypothetical protein